MSEETINSIVAFGCILLFFLTFSGIIYFGIHMENKHELKKLGILKPTNKVITVNPDYNEKLKYQIKSWSITIVAVIIICLICKLFGFSINDITDLLK